jgi:hypothetical protein
MRESFTNKFSSTELANGFKPEAKSLSQNILDTKCLPLNILPGLLHTPSPQVFRNEYFRESDEKKLRDIDMKPSRGVLTMVTDR